MKIKVQKFDAATFANPQNLAIFPPTFDLSNYMHITFSELSEELNEVLETLGQELGPCSKNYYNGVGVDRSSKTYRLGSGSGTQSITHAVSLIPVNEKGEYVKSSESHYLGSVLFYDDAPCLLAVISTLQDILDEKNMAYQFEQDEDETDELEQHSQLRHSI